MPLLAVYCVFIEEWGEKTNMARNQAFKAMRQKIQHIESWPYSNDSYQFRFCMNLDNFCWSLHEILGSMMVHVKPKCIIPYFIVFLFNLFDF